LATLSRATNPEIMVEPGNMWIGISSVQITVISSWASDCRRYVCIPLEISGFVAQEAVGGSSDVQYAAFAKMIISRETAGS
jgi:hypothetical protein